MPGREQAGLQYTLPDVVAYSKYPFRKHIYQGQTVPRAYELLISQLTYRVRPKVHESFEERGKNRLIFKVKKQEIQVQLPSRLHKACRKLPRFTRVTLLCSLLNFNFFTLLFPHFILAGYCRRHCNEEMGISSRIEAEHNHRLQKPVRRLA